MKQPKRMTYFQESLDVPYGEATSDELEFPTAEHPANLVSSLAIDGYHYPALDIDVPMEVVPSSTPGHNHVYFSTVKLTWDQYMRLMDALAQAGILETNYVRHSKRRGQSTLRVPGLRKVSSES